MRIREYYGTQAGDFGFLWKYQMLLGVWIVLCGVAVLLFPQILVALVSMAIILVGAGLIGSAWRLRHLERHTHGVARHDVFEW